MPGERRERRGPRERHGILRVATVALLGLGACIAEEPIPPAQPFLVVHAVLDAAVASHHVTVHWERDGLFFNTVDDATISVIGPGGAVHVARPDTSSPAPGIAPARRNGSYFVDLDVVPGVTYLLRVEVPGAELITGETTVPSAQLASTNVPFNTFSRQTDTLRLTWNVATGAARHLVDIRSELGVQFGYQEYSAFADRAIALPGTMTIPLDDAPVFPAGQVVLVTVAAVDTNFHEYYRPRTDPLAGAPPSRLSGGQGVFGAIVPIIVRRLDVQRNEVSFVQGNGARSGTE